MKMQRIANLLMIKNDQVLLLRKPRRGWYVAPGGKVDFGESIYEAALREFAEETGAIAKSPTLKGAYTMVIVDEQTEAVTDEWMLFTFISTDLDGKPLDETREGKLEWHPIEALHTLPMAEGDRTNLLFAVEEVGMQFGTFTYTEQYQLIKEKIQRDQRGAHDE